MEIVSFQLPINREGKKRFDGRRAQAVGFGQEAGRISEHLRTDRPVIFRYHALINSAISGSNSAAGSSIIRSVAIG
ncbi:MAG: hypothetical protein ACM3SX_14185 [Deltaproteobacteria bacterium]